MLKVSKSPCMQRIVAFVSAMNCHKLLMHSKTTVMGFEDTKISQP